LDSEGFDLRPNDGGKEENRLIDSRSESISRWTKRLKKDNKAEIYPFRGEEKKENLVGEEFIFLNNVSAARKTGRNPDQSQRPGSRMKRKKEERRGKEDAPAVITRRTHRNQTESEIETPFREGRVALPHPPRGPFTMRTDR